MGNVNGPALHASGDAMLGTALSSHGGSLLRAWWVRESFVYSRVLILRSTAPDRVGTWRRRNPGSVRNRRR